MRRRRTHPGPAAAFHLGIDPNTFPIFGLFSFVLFMTPVFKWIYVNVMRE